MRNRNPIIASAVTAALVSTAASADFGATVEAMLTSPLSTMANFGTNGALSESASMPEGYARSSTDQASDLVALAPGLSVRYLTRNAGHHTDMFAFWPNTATPQYLITCVEGSTEDLANGKKNPSVQRIDLASGEVTTVLRGMSRCDGIRATAWGTVLATEEASDGQAYELLDPTSFSEHTVTDRAAGTIVADDGATASTMVAKRDALPTMAWEGLEVLDSGVVIGGDELRPGSYEDANGSSDTDGGALFKFVPTTVHAGGEISDLSASPLVSGSVYAFQASCRDDRQQTGQGCEIGNGTWVSVTAANARSDADANAATGFYRPEDLHLDPTYTGEGVRFCCANTGNKGAQNYGEVICAIDSAPTTAGNGERTVAVNRFIEGDTQLNAPDNLAFQPNTGNLYVIEDNKNGDVWACLPDGADRDIKSDGCIRILSVVDTSAEPTGFGFSPDGSTAYVSIQHSDDPADGSMDVDGYGTDDLLVITGFGAAPGAAAMHQQLNLNGAMIHAVDEDTIRIDGLRYGGNDFDLNLNINMDGSWSL